VLLVPLEKAHGTTLQIKTKAKKNRKRKARKVTMIGRGNERTIIATGTTTTTTAAAVVATRIEDEEGEVIEEAEVQAVVVVGVVDTANVEVVVLPVPVVDPSRRMPLIGFPVVAVVVVVPVG
jgi:hypothetical protein